jgi:Flp pilus assembly protein TadD
MAGAMRASRIVLLVAGALLAGCVGEEAKHKAAGNVLFHNGDLAGAVREYRAAITAAPSDGNGYTLLGNALFEQGKIDEAKGAYSDGLARDAKAREARRGLATIALRQGRRDEARKLFGQLADEAPNDPEAQTALGKLLLAQGDLDGAEQHLRAALAAANNDTGALYCLGLTLARKKQRAEALEVLDRLEKLTPAQPYAAYGRAAVAASSGDRDGALDLLGKALDRGIGDLDAVDGDTAFAELRADPRFVALIAKARARAAQPQR